MEFVLLNHGIDHKNGDQYGGELFFGLPSFVRCPSNRIHKISFDAVEDDRAEEDDDNHKAKTICKVPGGNIAGAEEGVTESFDNRGHGVSFNQELVFLWD